MKMFKKKYVAVITDINNRWVKLSFEDGDFITISRNKLPEGIVIGQVVEVSFKTTPLLTIIKNIEKITKQDKDIQTEMLKSANDE